MTLATNAKPYGLSDIKLTSIDGITQVDLPAATKLTFKERVKSAEGVGDDMLSVVVSVREGVEWELEATGLPLEALAVIYGTTTSTTGVTPDQVKTLENHGAVRLPYFKIYGKSLGEGDDDVHCIIYKAKVTEGLDAPMEYGNLQMTKIKGIGIDDLTNGVFDWVQNETATALPGATGSPSAITCTPVPADGVSSIDITDDITLTFNNALAAGAENGIILVRSDTQAAIACARTIGGSRKVVTLNPSASLTASKTYLIIVPNVHDIYGQTFADTVYNFDTAA
jgi:hypothetical protein